MAKRNCSPKPQATVFNRIARRFVENTYASPTSVISPKIPVNRPISVLPLLADDSVDQWSFVRIRLFCNLATLHDQLLRPRRSCLIVVVNRGKRFASIYPIVNFFVQNNPNRRINGVFFAFTASAEDHACRTDLLTLHGRDVAGTLDWDLHRVPRLRKFMRIVDGVNLSAL